MDKKTYEVLGGHIPDNSKDTRVRTDMQVLLRIASDSSTQNWNSKPLRF